LNDLTFKDSETRISRLPSEQVSWTFILRLSYLIRWQAPGAEEVYAPTTLKLQLNLRLCQISSTWRQVALSTARIWIELSIDSTGCP
jgi:hypothetical protein